MPPEIVASTQSPTEVACDAVVVGAHSSPEGPEPSGPLKALDEALEGRLLEHLRGSGFKARSGDVAVVPTLGRLRAARVAVAGLGPRESAGRTEVLRASGAAARRLGDCPLIASVLHEGTEDGAGASAEGFTLGSYSFTTYKSDPRGSRIERVLLLDGPDAGEIERGLARAAATWLARDLTNEPAGSLYPETFAERAREVADSSGLRIEVFDEDRLAAGGFGGLLAVGAGSQRPPRLIELRYTPEQPAGRVALVGKGITFDTGGLSLKDARNMEDMKTDMAGGAAVLGAMSALHRLRPRLEVIGLIAAAENMPSGSAVKPGDVIRHYGGVTSEVLNTDAEGRLVLADALAYACEQGIEAVVDAATLTGACMVALGRKYAGLFSNDEALQAELEDAARRAGERVWPLPVAEEYRPDLDSDVADIRNSGLRYGGAIFAALFLREHVARGVPWAHLDIAGPARAESDYDEIRKGGTGVATRTFLSWLEGRGR